MAFSKEHKVEMLAQYETWLNESKAVFMLEYSKMGMKDIDTLRVKIRDAGGEGHVIKNTLMQMALEKSSFEHKDELTGTTLMGFALGDAPALAKVFAEVTAKSEVFKLKGGFLDKRKISDVEVKALAELPPLPIMRARLLGTLLAPATQLVRTLSEPARQVAAVVKAYSEKDSVPTAG